VQDIADLLCKLLTALVRLAEDHLGYRCSIYYWVA